MQRRQFLSGIFGASLLTGSGIRLSHGQQPAEEYFYHGRTRDYKELKIIDTGRKIKRIETFTAGEISIVRITTDDGMHGYGQISTYENDLSTIILHRMLARNVLGKDPADIDAIVDRCIEANYKYPWSFVCRALSGIDTAIWDLYGKILQKPVVELLGGQATKYLAYGSSMRRDIKPEDEAQRLKKLADTSGYRAFKIRVGRVNGHNQDQWPGRTEHLIPVVRKALSADIDLLVDGNSCYTPDKAIEVGRLLEDHGYYQFEEPCPYWELEWTKKVADTLIIPVSGGEQDNDLAQWRRMIAMEAVDIVQPDVCYLGGITRTLRVAQLASQVNLQLVPHSANLSLVTVFAVHLLGALDNAVPYLEYTIEHESGVNRQAKEVYSPQLDIRDGAVQIPQAPGWGVEISKDWLSRAEYQESEGKG
jgi:L-alanine-DL-glutamate epimerase-like enolase superfamily enzyme